MPNETDINAAASSEDTIVGSAPASVETATPEVAAEVPAETVAEVTAPVTEPETADQPEETTPHVDGGGTSRDHMVQATV